MRLCRAEVDGRTVCGRLEGGRIHLFAGDLTGGRKETGESAPERGARLLAPLAPGKIIGIGRNYAEHAREMGNAVPDAEPLIFLKPPSALLHPGDAIVLPAASARVDYEGELGVVIGKTARAIPVDEDPLGYVLGYSCVNDVTARDLQKKDVQFTRAKGFDTFCPFGPWIETDLDVRGLELVTRVNGEVRQKGNTRDMIFDVPTLIRFLSGVMTLYPGDLIATGTPAGIGPLAAGDSVEVELQGIGVLHNPVRS